MKKNHFKHFYIVDQGSNTKQKSNTTNFQSMKGMKKLPLRLKLDLKTSKIPKHSSFYGTPRIVKPIGRGPRGIIVVNEQSSTLHKLTTRFYDERLGDQNEPDGSAIKKGDEEPNTNEALSEKEFGGFVFIEGDQPEQKNNSISETKLKGGTTHIQSNDNFLEYDSNLQMDKSIVHFDFMQFSGVGVLFTSSKDRYTKKLNLKNGKNTEKYTKNKELNTMAVDFYQKPEMLLHFFDHNFTLRTSDLTFYSLTPLLNTRAKSTNASGAYELENQSVKTFQFVDQEVSKKGRNKDFIESTLIIVSASDPTKITNINNTRITILKELIVGSNGKFSQFDLGFQMPHTVDLVTKIIDGNKFGKEFIYVAVSTHLEFAFFDCKKVVKFSKLESEFYNQWLSEMNLSLWNKSQVQCILGKDSMVQGSF